MIELAGNIEKLLLDNDCVIVPDFGGFIAHYQPAHYIKEERLYLPPMRTIGFNPRLTLNDGLLAQAYMQAYHTDFPDATRRIEKKVTELKDFLRQEGCAEMPGIGTLHCDIHNTYEFQPAESGILSPALYGLDSFPLRPLGESSHATDSSDHLPSETKEKKHPVHLDYRWIGRVAATAAAVLLFFFLSVPVENTYVDKGNYASLGTNGLFDAIRSQSLATTLVNVSTPPQEPKKKETIRNNQNTLKPVTVKVEKIAKTEEGTKVADTGTETKSVTSTQTGTKGMYHLIVSSLTTAADAQQVADNYRKKGYNEASVVEGNGHFRVSLCGFSDKAAAYQKLNELKQDEAFQNAWVLGPNK